MIPLGVLGVVTLGLAWVLGGGLAGWAYLCLLALWLAPGLPIGAWLFGSRHAAAWVTGAALGYPLTAFLLWVPIGLGLPNPLAFALSWLAGTIGVWFALWPRRRARVELPAWSSRDTVALGLVLLIVPALVGRPFSRIGEEDDRGSRYYRAYFTADFLWHMALTAELEKFSQPPRDPYAATEPLHYYWLHFVPPAVAAAGLHAPVPDRVGRLTINALGTGLVFIASVFLFVWVTCGGRAGPAGLATALAVVASSAEGTYLIVDHLRSGSPLEGLRHLNVDAITSWFFNAITIDGLQRSLMYNPHHAMACAAGLVALAIAARAGSSMSAGVALAAGVALGLALMTSPFPGGVLTLVFAVSVGLDLLRPRPAWTWRVARLALSGAVVLAALSWCVANLAFEGAGDDLQFGLYARARATTFAALALAAGPVLAPALVGVIAGWRPTVALRPAIVGVGLSLVLMHFVHLRSADIWIGWRAGQILLITAPALGAVGLAALARHSRTVMIAFVLLVAAAGVPTTVLDIINAQDVGNRAMGPGFAWSVEVTADEQQAMEWMRRHTPKTAVVQMEPTERGRNTWTLIPSFGERRMAAGLPISLLIRPAYQASSERVHQLYATPDAGEAVEIARGLGINYLYMDRVERTRFPDAELKFDRHPELFMRVFANDEVRIYFVQ
jgi:hypothetical protein